MDSPETQEEEPREKACVSAGRNRTILRSCFTFVFSILILTLLALLMLYLLVLIGNLPIWSPISMPSQCRIVSSSVDLKSSKVCEIGFINYNAKNVFYPFDSKKYRCHYDYYWASVFKVEYVDHSGQARSAFAEAPNEALPADCRPNFGAAWITKYKFKVNETYQCWYTLGLSKVNINYRGLFNCEARDPSAIEMLKRYLILFTRFFKSWLSNLRSIRWSWDLIAGLLTGFATSLLSITLVALLWSLISKIQQFCTSTISLLHRSTIVLKRINIVASFSWEVPLRSKRAKTFYCCNFSIVARRSSVAIVTLISLNFSLPLYTQ